MAAQTHLSARARFNSWNLVVAGYVAATLGLLLDLPTIGSSQTSTVVTIAVGVSIGVGILLAAAGMLQLRSALDRDRRGARRALGMQGVGLIVFLLGVLGLQISSSLRVVLVSAVFVLVAFAVTFTGGLLLRTHYSGLGINIRRDVTSFLLGTALVFIGVVVILGSKIGYYFLFPDVTSTVINDVGAAISACGCVVAAYSSLAIAHPSVRMRAARPLPAPR